MGSPQQMSETTLLLNVSLAESPEELAGAAAQAGHELLGGGGVHVQLWLRERPGGVVGARRGPEMSSSLVSTPLVAAGQALGEMVVDGAQVEAPARAILDRLCETTAIVAGRLIEAARREREGQALVELVAELVARREEAASDDARRRARLASELVERLRTQTSRATAELSARVASAVPLLDLGKLLLPDALLLRRSPLSSRERALLRAGSELGLELLEPAAARAGVGGFLDLAAEIVFTLEERWDGSGPIGLAGEDIPLATRVVAVVREFDLHCELNGEHSALASLQAQAGTVYDPAVVRALEEHLGTSTAHEKAA